jgi:glycosyltransferase involved in cell wall biosynthesis
MHAGPPERSAEARRLTLDVVIPTFNRHRWLGSTLDSLQSADIPAGLDVRVIVVDNNSTDATRETVLDRQREFGGRLEYVFERRQGRSFALNAGIAAAGGDLVGMIDDDEEIDGRWFKIIHSQFGQPGLDFIGGPYVPRFEVPAPGWLPLDYPAVIGSIDGGEKITGYGSSYPGILMGGNAVIRRSVLDAVGSYKTSLGRTRTRLLAGEDEDMYRRLLASGATGLYIPELIIYHRVPAERLTKRYFRRWCFWRGVSRGVLDRESPAKAVYLAGVPRWLYGKAARGLLSNLAATFRRRTAPAEFFSNELAIWDLAGFFYGKHLYRPADCSS